MEYQGRVGLILQSNKRILFSHGNDLKKKHSILLLFFLPNHRPKSTPSGTCVIKTQ